MILIVAISKMQLLGVYATSKTAMLGLVKNLAMECAKFGIRVNGLAPGLIKTRFSKQVKIIILQCQIIIY